MLIERRHLNENISLQETSRTIYDRLEMGSGILAFDVTVMSSPDNLSSDMKRVYNHADILINDTQELAQVLSNLRDIHKKGEILSCSFKI